MKEKTDQPVPSGMLNCQLVFCCCFTQQVPCSSYSVQSATQLGWLVGLLSNVIGSFSCGKTVVVPCGGKLLYSNADQYVTLPEGLWSMAEFIRFVCLQLTNHKYV